MPALAATRPNSSLRASRPAERCTQLAACRGLSSNSNEKQDNASSRPLLIHFFLFPIVRDLVLLCCCQSQLRTDAARAPNYHRFLRKMSHTLTFLLRLNSGCSWRCDISKFPHEMSSSLNKSHNAVTSLNKSHNATTSTMSELTVT